MKPEDYKSLCRTIHRMYGIPLNKSYFDSCACCDDVYRGKQTKAQLFKLMDKALEDDTSVNP